MTPFNKKEQTSEEMINESIPGTPEEVKKIIRNLTNELMEKSQQVRILQRELKDAVKRKSAKIDVLLDKVALTMFSLPKVKDATPRMHTVDNVKTSEAILSLKRLMRDPDNQFMGAYFMVPMKGYSDGYARLETNSQAVWHLFEKLDADLKLQEPEK
jgi:hypothetical protein